MARSRYARPTSRAAAVRYVRRGAILFGIGLAITLGTFMLSAHDGGLFIVSFGPIIFGAVYLVQGGLALAKLKDQPAATPAPRFPAYPPPSASGQYPGRQPSGQYPGWQQPPTPAKCPRGR
ncbi:MAG: hypothetical protein ACRDJU_03915 [Actinomycetota bacterium]